MDTIDWKGMAAIEVQLSSILIVDDDPDWASSLKLSFEHEKMSVRVAKDGGQAHSAFLMHKPDFVILDLILPGESGFEICERFKKADEKVPVLVLTAIDLPESRDLALRTGADGYLVKPVEIAELLGTMRELARQVFERHLAAAPTDEESSRIRFECRCGKRFKVQRHHRGKAMTCPGCGESLTIPRD